MLISNSLELTLFIGRLAFLIFVSLILAYSTMSLIYSFWLELIAFMRNQIDLRKKQQIPCYFCIFCTDEEILKCAVHPDIALSKKAIGCPDYQPIRR